MKKLCIIGLGLIGSSIARGLAGKYEIIGYNRNSKVTDQALKDGVINIAAKSYEQALGDADIVVIAAALGAYEQIAHDIGDFLQPGTVVTDVGSVKTHAVFTFYNHMPPGVDFVPSHPIAGKEIAGYEAGDGKLFEGKKVVLTPLPKNNSENILEVENMWKSLGAVPEQMTPAEHDRIYAAVSHAPQLLAYAYQMAIKHPKYEATVSAKGDFETFTRISNSDANIWAEIFAYNSHNIMKFLEKMFNGLVNIDKFNSLVSMRQRLGGDEQKVELNGDLKIDAATAIFPCLLGNLLMFCAEDELEQMTTKSFSAADLHESLAFIENEVAAESSARDFVDYVGSGFKDFTVFSLYDVSDYVSKFEREITLLKALTHRKIFEITAAMEADNHEHLVSVLRQAQD